MTANLLPRIFTIDIGDTPTPTFEVQNLREAQKLCHEQWLKDDLVEAKSGGVPLSVSTFRIRVEQAQIRDDVLFVVNGRYGIGGRSTGDGQTGQGVVSRHHASF
jgi:hypothetical protein